MLLDAVRALQPDVERGQTLLPIDHGVELAVTFGIEVEVVLGEALHVLGQELVEAEAISDFRRVDLPEHQAVDRVVLHD